jgi:hypothetical protein
MVWKTANRMSCLLKTTGVILTLIFGLGVLSGTGFANSLCGGECCCPPHRGAQHHSGTMLQGIDVYDCCSGGAEMPCGIDSGKTSELPEFITSGRASNPSYTSGTFSNLNFLFKEIVPFHSRVLSLSNRAPYPYPSVSLYLQKLSLLI